jgi:YHS domain-containing protein
MTKDPVCKMVVDEKEAKWITEYEGVVYYFCSPECKQEFDDDPEEYVLIDLG